MAINSAPTEGVRAVPLSQLKSTFPVFKNPANRHRAVSLTHEQWQYAFTNTFGEEESRALYERYAIRLGKILWGIVLANFQPGHQEAWVDYKNDDRAPLLFISGIEDNLMPPKVQQSNAKRTSPTRSRRSRSTRRPRAPLPAQEGWEEVADHALEWALKHLAVPRPEATAVRARIGGPTLLIEFEGWRLLTDPTFDPPGATYMLGWVAKLRKLTAPAIAASDIGLIDAVLLSHDHHRRQPRRRRPRAAAVGGARHHDGARGPAAGRRSAGAGALGLDAARITGEAN